MRSALLGSRTIASLLIGAALGAAACSDTNDDATSVTFPLFTDLDEAAFDAACLAFRKEQAVAEGNLFTSAPETIDWADDIYAAIERATKEDKPIWLQTFCQENADPECDV